MDILVIDDNELMGHVLCRFVKTLGHTASSVSTLAEAREQATKKHFDLLLVDMRLPDAEGSEALVELRRLPGYESVVGIAISGDGQPASNEIEEAGFADYLTKPIEFSDLQTCIERIVAKSGAVKE